MSETTKGLDLLQAGNEVIELRVIMADGKWWHGFFDDRAKLLRVVDICEEVRAHAVYWTFNHITGRDVANYFAPATQGACTANRHISRLRWLFIDIDNKGSYDAVKELRDDVLAYTRKQKWDEPVSMDSGTGLYLFYPVDLATDQSKLVKKAINKMADKFDRPGAIIDRKCVNPSRIARVPGSYNRKNDLVSQARIIDAS